MKVRYFRNGQLVGLVRINFTEYYLPNNKGGAGGKVVTNLKLHSMAGKVDSAYRIRSSTSACRATKPMIVNLTLTNRTGTGTTHFRCSLKDEEVKSFLMQRPVTVNGRGAAGKLQAPAMRCDRKGYIGSRGGCIYSSQPGYLRFKRSDAAIAKFADHVGDAQAKLKSHPGLLGRGKPLTRTTSKARIQSNRNAAARKCRSAKVKGSCDEFPFASTVQGCGNAKTVCSVRGIPLAQNSKGGSKTNSFYVSNRILNGDNFWVVVS